MPEFEQGTQAGGPSWAEMAFDALDMPAVVFGEDLRLRAANAAWLQRFATDIPVGSGMTQTLGVLTDATPGIRLEGFSARDLLGLVRSFVRDYDLPRQGGGSLLLTSTPTADGGYLVTLRDPDRGRIVETRALDLLRDAIASLDMGMMVWDSGLIVRSVNEAWMRHVVPGAVGETVDRFVRRVLERGLGESRQGMTAEETLTAVIMDAHRHKRRWELRHSDGRHVRVSSFPMQSGGVLAVAFDATDRQNVEAQARNLVSDAIDALGDGLLLLDGHLTSQMHNRAFARLFHAPDHPPEAGVSVTELFRQSLNAGMTLLPDGLSKTAFLNQLKEDILACRQNVPTRHPDGRVVEHAAYQTAMGGYAVVFRDVSEQQAAEQAEREADELVRAIVDASPTTFLVSRVEDGKVIYAPPLSRERFGEIETTLSFFLSPNDRLLYLDALLKTGSLTDYPVRFRRKDGTIMDGLTSARVINFRGERLIVSATRDITDQLAMQTELERQRDLAHQNEKLSALGGLLASVAHELNNPLSIVVANAMMLEEDVQDPVLRRRVERLASAAKRSGRIVKTFLAMARNRPMRIERVGINEIIDTAVEISAYGLKAAGTTIHLDYDRDNPQVEVDADQIIQVLSNLLINAEHALRDLGSAGRLSLSTQSTGQEVQISVQDNGPGIPADVRGRVFEPYFTTKRMGEGTGVGLALCHRMITAHGGKVSVAESEGGGAAFHIVLPRTQGGAAADLGQRTPAPVSEAHVLVLDDEEDVAATVADMLERGGYRPTVVHSADQALEHCRTTRFGAILSDVRMPGTSGLSFFEELRRRDPPQSERLAFMTGDAMANALRGGIRETGRPIIEKPAEPKEILALVAELIGGSADAS